MNNSAKKAQRLKCGETCTQFKLQSFTNTSIAIRIEPTWSRTTKRGNNIYKIEMHTRAANGNTTATAKKAHNRNGIRAMLVVRVDSYTHHQLKRTVLYVPRGFYLHFSYSLPLRNRESSGGSDDDSSNNTEPLTGSLFVYAPNLKCIVHCSTVARYISPTILCCRYCCYFCCRCCCCYRCCCYFFVDSLLPLYPHRIASRVCSVYCVFSSELQHFMLLTVVYAIQLRMRKRPQQIQIVRIRCFHFFFRAFYLRNVID